MIEKRAEVVKLAYTHGSGSCGLSPCGFESHLRQFTLSGLAKECLNGITGGIYNNVL